MQIIVQNACGEIKVPQLNLTAFLKAAHDAQSAVEMAQGILAHPLSVELQNISIARLYKIAFQDGLPAPSEVSAMRRIVGLFLDAEVSQ